MSIDLSAELTAGAPQSQRRILRSLARRPLAVASALALAFIGVIAVIQPWILPFPPNEVKIGLTNVPPFTSEFLLGGDRSGRDILSRLIAGTREGLLEGFLLTGVALGVGVVAGLVAGYFGRLTDTIATAIFAVLISVPAIIVVVGLETVAAVPVQGAVAVLGLLSSPGIFYLVRSLTRSVREELYVDAARVSGLGNARIIGRHVLLAIKGPIIIVAAFLFGGAMAATAGLSFLGLGDPSSPSWGGMISDAFTNYYLAPLGLVWPALALGIAIAAFILLGNAVRDVLEGTYVKPSARNRRREIERLLGEDAAKKTLGAPHDPATSGLNLAEPLLQVTGLQIAYAQNGKLRTVVEGISLTIEKGEILGLVGESGSGKTQTALAVLGLLPDEAIIARGSIRLSGHELLGRTERELAALRGSQIAYVPQEPMSNLDPSFTVGSQLVEGIRAQERKSRRAAKALALEMLDRVGIADPARTFRSYPHEISGGMAQRVLIAGAVAGRPRLLIADEPTTALDVTVQAEVLDLLRDLQEEFDMGVLLVTHNFGVVADLCTRVAVMRTGKIVEAGETRALLRAPQHEYTKGLLSAVLDDTLGRAPLSHGMA